MKTNDKAFALKTAKDRDVRSIIENGSFFRILLS